MMDQLTMQLSLLQRELGKRHIPVMIVFEGFGSSGKGTMINELIQPMDPRGFKVLRYKSLPEKKKDIPICGGSGQNCLKTAGFIFSTEAGIRKLLRTGRKDGVTGKKTENCYNNILDFEKELTQDGMLILKFFLHISQKEQKKRFKALECNEETQWRVTEDDWKHNKDYDAWLKAFEEMIQKTDTAYGNWTIIEATDREYAKVKILSKVVEAFGEGIAAEERKEKNKMLSEEMTFPEKKRGFFGSSVLDAVDLSKSLSKTVYKRKLKDLQERMELLHSELYRRRIPVVIGFEGWDAGGKAERYGVLLRLWIPEVMR